MIGEDKKHEGALKPSSIEVDVFEKALSAWRITTIPMNLTRRWENDASGQPIFEGYAPRGLAEGTDGWLLYKNTYDGNSFITKSEVAYDKWSNRTGATYG